METEYVSDFVEDLDALEKLIRPGLLFFQDCLHPDCFGGEIRLPDIALAMDQNIVYHTHYSGGSA